jgi:hypothetical protein|tara:strand:+ start:1762 stop:2658 length:897 start_codon:yes stop_codon:yes gene_type:complete
MPTTIAYSNKGGYWKTKYTWFASFMEKVGRKFFTSSIDGASTSAEYPSSLVWKHNEDDDTKRTNYYDQVGGSGVSVSFNDRVSSNKIYKSISLEGTSNIQDESFNTFVVNADNNPAKQFSMGRIKDKGGILYGHIGLSNTLLDGSNVKVIGSADVSSLEEGFLDAIVFESGDYNFRQKTESVTNNSKFLFFSNNSFYNLDFQNVSLSEGSSFAEVSADVASLSSSADGSVLFEKVGGFNMLSNPGLQTVNVIEITPQEINGAPPRGQYAQADIVLGSQPYELYSINVNYEPTDLDHSK